MAALPASTPPVLSPAGQLELARTILNAEARSVLALAERLGVDFCRAVHSIASSRGAVIVTGMGKAGLIGQKITATLASTGTRSHFLHPAEAIHGDLGRVHADDVLLVLSYSGETEEVTRILPPLKKLAACLIAITGQPRSTLGRLADVTLDLGPLREACPLGLAPSASTTAMLALGDALALVLSRMRGFGEEDFARFHPGGSLGRKLAKVEDVMRPLAECRVAGTSQSVRDTLIAQRRPGRRTGAVMVVHSDGTLAGIFTDSDLARLLERKQDEAIDGPIGDVMTSSPTCTSAGTLLRAACDVLAARKISELPVVDDAGRPLGLIDITDIVGASREDEHQNDADREPTVLKLVTAAEDEPISTMRNAECGVRNRGTEDGGQETKPFPAENPQTANHNPQLPTPHSALRTPHSP
jgi:arabinose-5-phosphate isomerase